VTVPGYLFLSDPTEKGEAFPCFSLPLILISDFAVSKSKVFPNKDDRDPAGRFTVACDKDLIADATLTLAV
jgi:hypothetical protein